MTCACRLQELCLLRFEIREPEAKGQGKPPSLSSRVLGRQLHLEEDSYPNGMISLCLVPRLICWLLTHGKGIQ